MLHGDVYVYGYFDEMWYYIGGFARGEDVGLIFAPFR